MSERITVNVKIDSIIKEKAESILKDSNLTLSEAAELFFTQVTVHKELPFDLRTAQFRHLANEELYEKVEVLHCEMLFTPSRIERSSLPDNIYLYEVQYDDNDIGKPEIIKEHVICNFLGTLLSKERLEMPDDNLILITEDTNWIYSSSMGINLDVWIAR